MQIYFAGPLSSQAEKRFNVDLASRLEALGFTVFLPQRDGVEKSKPAYAGLSKAERRKRLFELDTHKVYESEIFIFILDGRVPDEGACVELGIAWTLKKHLKQKIFIVGLKTGNSKTFYNYGLNPMLRGCFDYLVSNEEELIALLRKHHYDSK